MKLKLSFFLLLLVIQTAIGQYEDIKFYKYNISDGLSSISVNSILQDKKGFLWLATDDGLNRYDGYSFKIYRNDPEDTASLSNNYIWSICEDQSGMIWAATEIGGLNMFDPVSEKFYRYMHDPSDPNSISSNILQTVFADNKNNIWIGTWGGGLNFFNRKKKSFKRFLHNEKDAGSISNNKIFSILQDSKDNLWIGTDGGGLNRLKEDHTFITYTFGNGPTDNSISKIYEDSDGILWLGTFGSGVIQFNPETGSFIRSVDSGFLKDQHVWDIIEDIQGYIWIATQSDGISIYDKSSASFYNLKTNSSDNKSLGAEQTKSLFSDRSGVLWTGTLIDGLYKTDRKKQKFYQIKNEPGNDNSLPENYVLSICGDSENNLWIGMYNNLCRFDPVKNKFIKYPLENKGRNSVDGSVVRYIFEDSNRDVWVGTYFGKLNKYNPETDTFSKIDLNFDGNNPSANFIRAIYEDRYGILWFCSNGGGIFSYDRISDKFQVFRADSTSMLSSDYVISAGEDKFGNLWFGTQGFGLNIFDRNTKKFINYKPDSSRTPSGIDVVSEIFLDSKGNLWFGSNRGGLFLYNYEDKSLTRYSEKEGLKSNSVYGILEDGNNSLWISTSRGISKINTADGTIKNFDHSDGLINSEFNPSSAYKTKTGIMYFGGIQGINYFHPDSIVENQYVPPVVLTSFKLFNKEFELPVSLTYTDTIFLDYDQNNLSFEFASLDYTNPSQNKYAYMIEGIDKVWNFVDNKRSVNFTQLNPGEYIIKFKGTNNDGLWNETGIRIALIISPPLWATWWAYSFYATLFVFILIRFRSYELNKRKRKEIENLEKEKALQEEFSRVLLKSQEEERKRIASELHDSLGQNLLIIKNRALLGVKSADNDFSKKQLTNISEGASSAIEEVRRISYNLHPYHLDSLGLTKAIRAIIDNLESSTQINFHFELDNIDDIFEDSREINFFRIIQETINNIIKHSKATEAVIKIVKEPGTLSVIIKDNGIGFNQNTIQKTTDPSKGFGLNNLKRRIEILQGSLSILSESGKGTKIDIKIPIYDEKQS